MWSLYRTDIFPARLIQSDLSLEVVKAIAWGVDGAAFEAVNHHTGEAFRGCRTEKNKIEWTNISQ